MADTLSTGGFLEPGQELISTSKRYKLTYQTDGNLVLYTEGKAIWSTETYGKPAWRTVMQEDGNLVVYGSEGNALWASNTAGQTNCRLVMQSDGNLVIYNGTGGAPWASGTAGQDQGGAYDTNFTLENEQLLRDLNLYNVDLELSDKQIESVDIEWSQMNRDFFGSSEPYKECIYKMKGSESHVKVFVADSCGAPPASFNTSGVNYNGGTLHFGYVFSDDDDKVKAIFFVIHPPDRKPFQGRFRTTFMLALLRAGVEEGFARVSGAIIGAAVGSIVPVVGTAVGGAIGFVAGEVSSMTFDALYGDYLRYIG